MNLSFAAGANGAVVGLATPPVRVSPPALDPALPGSWLVDLSHVDPSRVKVGKQWRDHDGDLLPSPFTPTGQRPTGPAWYATPTVTYALELGYNVTPAGLSSLCGLPRQGTRHWYSPIRHLRLCSRSRLPGTTM